MSDFSSLIYRDGVTYNHQRDARRLAGQHARVFALMKDGVERTFKEIADATGDPEASISARLRDFRKERFQKLYGRWVVESRYVQRGLWKYRLRRAELFD